MLSLLEKQPYLYLDEIQDQLAKMYHVWVSVSSIWHALKKVKWNKKVVRGIQ